MAVVELRAHQLHEDAAAAVRRQHADDGRAADVDVRPARHRHSEREHAGAADDRVAVERRVNPVHRYPRGEALGFLRGRFAAEVVADRVDGAAQLVHVPAGTNLDRHAP
ncbi:MAG TPA: hypothetical protein VJP39_03330 [Gaiellaceae bacterium]|nr:hypothetical protein [Gaiellaceae bacterium]